MPALQGDYDDPINLLIVGLDEIPEKIQAEVASLEDPDRIDPAKVRKDLIASVARFGVRQPVTVKTFRLGDRRVRVVTNGRQRVMAARAANVKADPPIRVPYVVVPDDDSAATVRVANSGVRTPTLKEKMADAKRLKSIGYKNAEIAAMFSNGNTGEPVSVQTISNWLNGGAKKASGEESSDGGDGGDSGPSKPSRKVVSALLDLYTGGEALDAEEEIVRAVLLWTLTGDDSALSKDVQKQVKRVTAPGYKAEM